MQNRLQVYTPCWGDHFTNLLENALGRSFRFPQNAKALENCIWNLQIDAENSPAIQIAKKIIPTAEIRTIVSPRISQPQAPIGALKMQGLLKVIKSCIEEKSPMLMATPDFIWGDGTIENMRTAASLSPGLCVSIAHMRVLPSILHDQMLLNTPTNAKLMGLGIEHAHESWKVCNSRLPQNGIYHSGICWTEVKTPTVLSPEGLILVQHQMPSPFLVNFMESDLRGFETWKGMTPPAFGEWDHNWPTDLLNQTRLRYIGGSDAACMLEVTEAGANMPPINSRCGLEKPNDNPELAGLERPGMAVDEFFLHGHHNSIQRQFVAVFRYL